LVFFKLFFPHVRGEFWYIWAKISHFVETFFGGSKTPGVHITDLKRGQVQSVKERESDRKRLTRPTGRMWERADIFGKYGETSLEKQVIHGNKTFTR